MRKDTTPRIAIIGAGFSGLSTACYLAGKGYEVQIFEKNESIGGRARQLKTAEGYLFDMGPSWYWMPDVFEKVFSDFGYKVRDWYDLKLLDPGFEMVFKGQEALQVPADTDLLYQLFDSIEPGGGDQLRSFLDDAAVKYKKSMEDLVYLPNHSVTEYFKWKYLKDLFRLNLFSSFSRHVRQHFKDPRLIALMEFPVLFLGTMPQETPALYSLMNYGGLQLGTWYPQGGFGKVIDALAKIAEEKGVKIHTGELVSWIEVKKGKAIGLIAGDQRHRFDAVIASADYHHVDSTLLPGQYRNYSEAYWDKRTLAPSALIFYIGISKRIKKLHHHTLFFDEDLYAHSVEIYKDPKWPAKPLFYVCCPSKSDAAVAPEGHENLFFLMPLAPGVEDTQELREQYFSIMLERLEKYTGETGLSARIDCKISYCVNDFIRDYNSFKGNAYGLANTLSQTAVFKPKMRSKKVENLFYTGQLTVPGPGVPPALISGNIVAREVDKYFKNRVL